MLENELKKNKTDLLTSAAKSVFGALPVAGPLLSELIGNLIPDQRIDRLSKYITELESKLSDLSTERIRELLKDSECIDLFEEGFVQASRAITDKRQSQIASVVRNGLDDESIAYSESKYVLKLLQELNEQEIIWLRYHLHPTIGDDEEFRNKHKNVLERVYVTMESDESVRKKAALQESYIEHLERLGLISPQYTIDRDTGVPEFDTFTGRPAVSYYDITFLGHLVLKQIGLIDKE